MLAPPYWRIGNFFASPKTDPMYETLACGLA
jgi:hypothetical protein